MAYRPKHGSTRAAMSFEALNEATGEFQRLTSKEDTGEHVSYGDIMKAQSVFMREVMGLFRAYDEELREMSGQLSEVRTKVGILMWLAGTSLVGVVSLLMKLAFRSP